MRVRRSGDMHPEGVSILQVTVSDGDVIVAIDAPSLFGKPTYASIEFCNPVRGGGRSPETHKALLQLANCIQMDNERNKK